MKKHLLLTGLVSVLLIAGMMFTACPMDSGDEGDDGISVPEPGDLPSLPAGKDYVANEAEVQALLADLRAGFSSVSYEVRDLIEGETDETDSGYSWNVKDDTSITGLKINSTGGQVYKTNLPDLNEKYEPKEGDYQESTYNNDTSVEFIGTITKTTVTIYQESTVKFKEKEYMKMTILSGGKVGVNISEEGSYAYGLTAATTTGKGGKIILDARFGESVNKDFDYSEASSENFSPTMSETYTGSLKVYGADDDTPVYTKNIATKADYNEVMGYFN